MLGRSAARLRCVCATARFFTFVGTLTSKGRRASERRWRTLQRRWVALRFFSFPWVIHVYASSSQGRLQSPYLGSSTSGRSQSPLPTTGSSSHNDDQDESGQWAREEQQVCGPPRTTDRDTPRSPQPPAYDSATRPHDRLNIWDTDDAGTTSRPNGPRDRPAQRVSILRLGDPVWLGTL